MAATIHEIVKRQAGRPQMTRENRRWMRLRINQGEQLMILDSIESRMQHMDEDELRIAKILIGRVVAL